MSSSALHPGAKKVVGDAFAVHTYLPSKLGYITPCSGANSFGKEVPCRFGQIAATLLLWLDEILALLWRKEFKLHLSPFLWLGSLWTKVGHQAIFKTTASLKKFYKSFMFFMYFSSKTYALFDCQDAFWFLRHKRKLFDNQIASVHKSSNFILITYHVYIHALKSHLA